LTKRYYFIGGADVASEAGCESERIKTRDSKLACSLLSFSLKVSGASFRSNGRLTAKAPLLLIGFMLSY